jgi:hypothetical protein
VIHRFLDDREVGHHGVTDPRLGDAIALLDKMKARQAPPARVRPRKADQA